MKIFTHSHLLRVENDDVKSYARGDTADDIVTTHARIHDIHNSMLVQNN